MRCWLDAQLSPALAHWMRHRLGLDAVALRDLGLHDANDLEIFEAARREGVAVMTKDRDFVTLLERHGPPPAVIWVTCGNTSTARLSRLLEQQWPTIEGWLREGEPLVEIRDGATAGTPIRGQP